MSAKRVFPLKAKALALRALDIDDGLAEAHASLGQIFHLYDWDWAGAKQHFTRAMDLNPGYAFGYQLEGAGFMGELSKTEHASAG